MEKVGLVQRVSGETQHVLADYATSPETRAVFAQLGTTFEKIKTLQKLAKVTEKGLLNVLRDPVKSKCLIRLLAVAQGYDSSIDTKMQNTVLNFASFLARMAARVSATDIWSPDMVVSFLNLQNLLIMQTPALDQVMKLCSLTRPEPAVVHATLSALLDTSAAVVAEMRRFEQAADRAPRTKTMASRVSDFFKDAFRIMLKSLLHAAIWYVAAYKKVSPAIWANLWAVILDYFNPTGWARVVIDALLKPELSADLPSLGRGSRTPGLLYGLVQTLDNIIGADKSPLFWMVQSTANVFKAVGFVKPIFALALNYVAQDYPQVVDLVSGYAESVVVLYLAQYALKWFLKFLGNNVLVKLFDLGRDAIVSILYGSPEKVRYRDEDVVGYECAETVCRPVYKGQQLDAAVDLFVTLRACQRACTLRGGYQGTYFGHC
jgi:hypothetical protein